VIQAYHEKIFEHLTLSLPGNIQKVLACFLAWCTVDGTSNTAAIAKNRLRLPTIKDFTEAYIIATKRLQNKEFLSRAIDLFVRALHDRTVYEEMLRLSLSRDFGELMLNALREISEYNRDPRLLFLIEEVKKLSTISPQRISCQKSMKMKTAASFFIENPEMFDNYCSSEISRISQYENITVYGARTNGVFDKVCFEIEFTIYGFELDQILAQFDTYSQLLPKIRLLAFFISNNSKETISKILEVIEKVSTKLEKIVAIGVITQHALENVLSILAQKVPEEKPVVVDKDVSSFLYTLGAFLTYYAKKYLKKI